MAQPAEMLCQELVEVVTEYVEGTLHPADRLRFEEHLKTCSHCVTYLDQMRKTIRALGRLPEESIPEIAKHELLQAFRTWKKNE